jgi:hypothetical protein
MEQPAFLGLEEADAPQDSAWPTISAETASRKRLTTTLPVFAGIC